MRILWLVLLLCFSPLLLAKDCVVLLHGLGKSKSDMDDLTAYFAKRDYATVNFDYPSRSKTIEKLAIDTVNDAVNSCPKYGRVHFVTHSMGGILVRYYLSQHKLSRLGRVVMLGPPNNGSEVVDTYRELALPLFKAIMGPAGLQLGTGQSSIVNKLGDADFELGVIAGTRSLNLIQSQLVPGEDDGTVSVSSTKLAGMKDHIELPVSHSFMMKNSQVIKQAFHFIEHGEFSN